VEMETNQKQAHNLVAAAVAKGQLIRQPCECGRQETDAHHDDYSRPLDVRWVCRRCHQGLPHSGQRSRYQGFKIAPDVDRELRRLKKKWQLQSHNKVLRRLLKLNKDADGGGQDA